MGFGLRAPQRGRGLERRAAPRGPCQAKPLKRPSRRDASGKHRQRKEERRAQPENSLRRGRDEALAPLARQPSQVLALAFLRSGPALEEFERSEHNAGVVLFSRSLSQKQWERQLIISWFLFG